MCEKKQLRQLRHARQFLVTWQVLPAISLFQAISADSASIAQVELRSAAKTGTAPAFTISACAGIQ
jgi:hypothetical protein